MKRNRVSRADAVAQRAANTDAPRISHLLWRLCTLFAPHRPTLIVTVVLVLVSAALSVIPPLLTQRAFDEGLFPLGDVPNFKILGTLDWLMLGVYLLLALLGVWQTWLTATVGNSVMGALRVRLFTHLQAQRWGTILTLVTSGDVKLAMNRLKTVPRTGRH
jgi:ATP-binding cassette subfamily B protein